jgi:hypothetical protein
MQDTSQHLTSHQLTYLKLKEIFPLPASILTGTPPPFNFPFISSSSTFPLKLFS